MRRESDASRYEILFDAQKSELQEKGPGGMRTKTIRAGSSLEVEAFPIVKISQEARREKKRKQSTPAMIALNLRNARKRVYRLLEANFTENDIHLTLTFDYGFIDRAFSNSTEIRSEWEKMGYPEDDQEAQRYIRNFIRRVRNRMQRVGNNGRDLKYLYVIESTKEPRDGDMNSLPARYHFHIVISCPGLGREDVEKLWPYGYANADKLRIRDGGLAALSKYITKQRRCTRRWAASRNLKEPVIHISDRKISRRRAELVARDVRAFGKEIFEKLYPGFNLDEEPQVRFSDWLPGAYIYARMHRIQ